MCQKKKKVILSKTALNSFDYIRPKYNCRGLYQESTGMCTRAPDGYTMHTWPSLYKQ